MNVLVLALCLSVTHAYLITLRNVHEKLKLLNPVLMIADELFKNHEDIHCVEKAFCLLETMTDYDIMNPLKHFSRYLTNSHNDAESLAFLQIDSLLQKYEHVMHTINAINYGRMMNETSACNNHYSTCNVSSDLLTTTIKAFDDDHIRALNQPHPRAWTSCAWAGIGCGVVGIGCGVCSTATSATCAAVCVPGTAKVCGGVGVACGLKEGLGLGK